MESRIILEDLYITRDPESKIEFKIVDEENNPVTDGVCVIKLNKVSLVKSNIEKGLFSNIIDLTSYTNDEYELTVIYGGNAQCDPTDINVTLHLENPEEESVEEVIDDENNVSIKKLQDASFRLIKWIDINKKLPGKIMINNQQVPISNVLFMLSKAVVHIDNNDMTSITSVDIKTPRVSKENITEKMTLSKEDYVLIAENIIDIADKTGELPSSIDLNDKKIGFMNLLYILATITANSSTEGLLTKVNIKPWKSIVA
ncbi:MAG: hypothetical protein LUG89_00640 [Methanosphaera sp.]|nr:hypothetical protein [Methanosphaera sp.]